MSGRRLAPCPDKPNCVSTQSTDAAKRMPALGFAGGVEPVRAAILDVLARAPRARVVEAREDYIHAEGMKMVLVMLNTFFALAVALTCIASLIKLSLGA